MTGAAGGDHLQKKAKEVAQKKQNLSLSITGGGGWGDEKH